MKKIKNSVVILFAMLSICLMQAQTVYTLQFHLASSTNRLVHPGDKIGPLQITVDSSAETNDLELRSFPVVLNYLSSDSSAVTSVEIKRNSVTIGVVANIPSTFDSLFFERELLYGDFGPDAYDIQRYLNEDPRTVLTNKGPGTLGEETYYFGRLTSNALAKFQEIHGLTNSIGQNLNEETRTFINGLGKKKSYHVLSVPFDPPILIPTNTISTLEIYISTSEGAYGQLQFHVPDQTDWFNDAVYVGTTNWVIENFNPRLGWTNSFVIQPRLEIGLSNNWPVVIAHITPGTAHVLEYSTGIGGLWYELAAFQSSDGYRVIPITEALLGIPREFITNLFFRSAQLETP